MDRFRRDLCPKGLSTGLSALLQELDLGDDSSISDSKEQSLNYVLDAGSGYDISFISDNKLNLENMAAFLQMEFQKHQIDKKTSRDGITVVNNGESDAIVAVDKVSAAGDIKLIRQGSVIESQASFSSIRANACVSSGKWMYEVTLETAGIQQLGWATRTCKFTRQEGVGDSADSYAYDGRRVRKWNESPFPYGQLWVSGDVIGCCINLDRGEISFLRNGASLGIAFTEVGKPELKLPYYPAISLSQGERCDLNFGGRPFKYPIKGYEPIQSPPIVKDGNHLFNPLRRAEFLLGCLRRLLQLNSKEVIAAMAPVERLKRLKPLGEDSILVGREICRPLASLLMLDCHTVQYVIWGGLVPFLTELYRFQPPHDGVSVDIALETIFSFLDSRSMCDCICEIMEGLAFGCRTSPIILSDSPYTGSYPYLALACHLIRRQDFLTHWCTSETFELCLEGLLVKKGPNKYDLEKLMPTVWWPGSREDFCTENNMRQTAQAMSKSISKVEELHWELSQCLLDFAPSTVDPLFADSGSSLVPKSSITHPSGSVFMSFLRYLVCKNKGAARNVPPPGLSDNSVLMTAYTVLLRFLSEGYTASNIRTMSKVEDSTIAFLHRGGKRTFSVQMFLDADSYTHDFARLGGTFSHLCKARVPAPDDYDAIVWEEGCMEEESERKVTHLGKLKPACCSGTLGSPVSCNKGSVRVLNKGFNVHVNSVSESSGTSRSEHDRRNCTEDEEEKPSSSGRVDSVFRSPSHCESQKRNISKSFSSDAVFEEELLDIMVLLYHLGVAPNFKQASYYLQHQLQAITQLDDTDRQIRNEKTSSDLMKRLKEARAVYREDLIECVRQSTWYKVSLFSKWKQRGMFATCMWIVQLLLVLSGKDTLFSFVPEYYIDTLLDCFHALRRSDPLFISPTALLQQGLSPLITFLVTHFNDTRIANSDIRDALLQSISVLVQYKEHVVAFESNASATGIMPAALLSAFDNRFWIPVTNILLRLCKGTGFGSSKSSTHGESCSLVFQNLLREKCIEDEKLFTSFLNRLFNTLNWTVTEFSVSVKDMQDHRDQRQVVDLQQRKCSIMFELSCNLERILEFFTRELPQAFLCGPEMNLIRLCELMMFVLNHNTSTAETNFYESTLRHQVYSLEKINRAMILAPLVGIVLNLSTANVTNQCAQHDLALTILNVDVSSVAIRNFESLVLINWFVQFKGDPSLARLPNLQEFVTHLKEASIAREKDIEEDSTLKYDYGNTADEKEDICSICYACEINTIFSPCNHKSCLRCISRHLLNNQRCFFCNATVQDLHSMSVTHSSSDNEFGLGKSNEEVGEGGLLVKVDSP